MSSGVHPVLCQNNRTIPITLIFISEADICSGWSPTSHSGTLDAVRDRGAQPIAYYSRLNANGDLIRHSVTMFLSLMIPGAL